MFKVFLSTFIFLTPLCLSAQIENLHGDERYSYEGLHSGNMIRTTFHNDGQVGKRNNSPEDIDGEWPINSGKVYLACLNTLFGSEVRDIDGERKHIISESNGTSTGGSDPPESSGDWGPAGEWWTMAPLPGFSNETYKKIAMSHWDWSWPHTWPDKFDDSVDPGWAGSWNGYFGKNVLNADQESYYVMDDYNNREFAFYPDSTDSLRRGLGLRVTVRGFQWSNVLVEDILFLLYDAKNIGTHSHDKMLFSIMVCPYLGNSSSTPGDYNDDGGAYNLEEELGYQFDSDNIGSGGWTPVGLVGVAFFESPGNPFDGIDNDGDAIYGSGPIITDALFAPVVVQAGQDVVLIDYSSFERSVVQMPEDGVSIEYQDRTVHFEPGDRLVEIENNLFDDNLNGIIDEINGSTFGEGDSRITRYIYQDLKYVDYFTGEGLDNPLIDEQRDDGIDNDGDWDINFDDVGLDGVPNTGDPGENDGIPSSGKNTDLPGEPHIDKTDIDESDMIGLTAYNIFTPWTLYPLADDEVIWNAVYPGFLNAMGQIGDTDVLLGSGFFPLKPEQVERYSVGYIMAYGEEQLFRNKSFAEVTYIQNYNFSKAPYIPTLTAIPGDKRVTLIWNDLAEKSVDPITGEDFEGYRIYRSTDPGFNDIISITDGYGTAAYKKPIVQFDLENGILGYSSIPVRGTHFWLGEDSGLQHTWIDTTVKNGFEYYYAVTSYDAGSAEMGIAPTECSKYISITKDGAVDKGKNVAIARPEAPSAGYVSADFDSSAVRKLSGSTAQGFISYEVIEPNAVKENHTYRISFKDTLVTSNEIPQTLCFTLENSTTGEKLLVDDKRFSDGDKLPLIDGFILTFHGNPEQLAYNAEKSLWKAFQYPLQVRKYRDSAVDVRLIPGEFKLVFGEVGIDTSTVYFMKAKDELPAMPVNFSIYNTINNKQMKFAFRERDANKGEEGLFSYRTAGTRSDEIILLSDSSIASWQINFTVANAAAGDTLLPVAGDSILIGMDRPFLSNDIFEFVTIPERIDEELARQNLDDIKVVPNPYVVSNSWEPQNPYTNGRGPREIHFINLPVTCTIKIFNIRGQLVRELEHHTASITDGTEIWDMQTKDKLDISYGIYVYHIDAGELGQKIGKLAVIK